MSWRDRPYSGGGEYGGYGGMGLGLLRPTPAVLGIIIACFVVYLLAAFSRSVAVAATDYGALIPPPGRPIWQVWRFVTYQYLHGGVWHIFGNMLGVFFFGPSLERRWG